MTDGINSGQTEGLEPLLDVQGTSPGKQEGNQVTGTSTGETEGVTSTPTETGADDTTIKEPQTVPLDTFLRKKKEQKEAIEDLKRDNQVLRNQINQVIEIEKTRLNKGDSSEPTLPDDFEDRYLDPDFQRQQSKLLQKMAREVTQLKTEAESATNIREQKRINTIISSVDSELSSEGFPGFSDLGQNVVREEIERISEYDQASAQSILDSPEKWKRIYKNAYPDISTKILNKFSPNLTKKKKAKLPTEPTKMVKNPSSMSTPNSQDAWAEYMKERNE